MNQYVSIQGEVATANNSFQDIEIVTERPDLGPEPTT
jgi:hypothetical protein